MTGKELAGILYGCGILLYMTGIVSMIACAAFMGLFGEGIPLPSYHSAFWWPTSIAISGLLLMCAGLFGGTKRGTPVAKSPA